MKSKIGASFRLYLKAPHIYLEDLLEIENIIKNELKAKSYKLETATHSYDSVDEISKENKILHELKITSSQPFIIISLTPTYATVRSLDSSLDSIGAAQKIADILKNRQRILLWFLLNGAGICVILFFFLLLLGTIFRNNILTIIGFIMCIPSLHASFRIGIFSESIIEFKKLKDRQTFVERNWDQIVVGLIIAVVSAVLGIILTISAQYYINPK